MIVGLHHFIAFGYGMSTRPSNPVYFVKCDPFRESSLRLIQRSRSGRFNDCETFRRFSKVPLLLIQHKQPAYGYLIDCNP